MRRWPNTWRHNCRRPALSSKDWARIDDLGAKLPQHTMLIAMLLEELVRDCGCEVAGLAANVESARRARRQHDYDAVLLDIGLQRADGRARGEADGRSAYHQALSRSVASKARRGSRN